MMCGVNANASFTEKYNATYLNLRNGLPNNFVDDIYQDSKGFIWIATHGGGLVRYDGSTYLYYGIGQSDYPLKSNSCRCITEDDFHRLWITFEEYTDVFDLQQMSSKVPLCTTEELEAKLNELLSENGIRVYNDGHHHIWVITSLHIYALSFDSDGKVCGISGIDNRVNIPEVAIKYVNGVGVWVAYGGKLHRFEVSETPAKGITTLKEQAPSPDYTIPENLYITDILPYDNKVWFSTNSGLYLSDDNGLKEFRHTDDPRSLSHDFVTCLAVSPCGKLMVGTLRGVDILRNDGFEHWNVSTQVNPLASNFINCIYSHNGLLWVGTETGGITELSSRRLNLVNYVHSAQSTSISPNAVNAMYVQPDGTAWVGTVEGGLNRMAKGTGQFTHYNTSNSALSHNSVSTLTADGKGRLWIGTWAGGVNLMNPDDPASLHPLKVDSRYTDVLRFIGALAYDPYNEAMWIGSNDGVFYYDLKTDEMSDPFPECRNVRGCIGSIVDREGVLWMGCITGMIKIPLKGKSKGKFKAERISNKLDDPESGIIEKITSFCEDNDGTLWLGSNAYGLYHRQIDKDGKETFKAYTARDGLSSNIVKGIAVAPDGMLWIATGHGLSLLNPKTEVFANYTEDDGLVSSQFYWNGALTAHDGWLLFGSEKGLTAIKSTSINTDLNGELIFTRLKVNNHDVKSGSRFLDTDITQARKISLYEGDKSVDIDFATLCYMGDRQGVYSYCMKGYDDEWIQLQPGVHTVHYTSLPSGSYEFQVRYASAVGDVEEQMATISVNVSPYFWKSWWFIALCLILAAIVVHLLYSKRMEKLRRREREHVLLPIKKALKESDTPQLLQKRIESILGNQKKYQASQEKSLEADKIEFEKVHKPFVEKLMEVMEGNYTNADFGVAELSEAMGVSMSVLNKKVSSNMGVRTTEFIRNYRLDIARKLILKKGGRNISEIAFSVGFNDPKYFTRCFTKLYGVSPSSYKGE